MRELLAVLGVQWRTPSEAEVGTNDLGDPSEDYGLVLRPQGGGWELWFDWPVAALALAVAALIVRVLP